MKNLATEISFGNKEQFMICLNDFIQSQKNTIEKYLNEIILPSSTAVPSMK